MDHDTIAAISSAVSESGIGIIRISGSEAIRTADKIFRSKSGKRNLSDFKSHSVHYGFIYDKEEIIDEVLILVMYAPHTFTGEDTVEIDCHGGILSMRGILEAAIHAGARLAEPGEFTKRAFLNGRIDLSQAEAVMELIQSKSIASRDNSLKQLSGKLSGKIKNLRKNILLEIARIEASLDDPEHLSLEGYSSTFAEMLYSWKKEIRTLIKSSQQGSLLRDGIRTVIIGKPNVGKSSLLNLLTGQDRAIVTEIAGTTRDTLEEYVNLGGISLKLIDTAGIRNTKDPVESIGVQKALEKAKEADLILLMLDSSSEWDDEDKTLLYELKNKKGIVLINKSDLEMILPQEEIKKEIKEMDLSWEIIEFSAMTGLGKDKLEEAIQNMFFSGNIKSDDIVITSERHKLFLTDALNSLIMVEQSIDSGVSEDFYTIDLMDAYEALGFIIGEEVDDDLVNEIFSNFCLGK